MTPTLPLSLGTLLLVAVLTPPLVRRFGRDAGWVVALGFLAAFALLAPSVGAALDGDPAVWSVPWVTGLVGDGVTSFALRLDALSLLFVVLILGIGALVLAYTARYAGQDSRDAKTPVLLTVFAASMLTLVLADDIAVLYLGWELTSVVSFLLIGGDGIKGSVPARRAFVVTAAGGLALLGALVLLATAAGTTSLSGILASPDVASSPTLPAVAVLLLLAIGTKSALVPFGFWLRGAMVAPTPVSTYLHAATMVKAGIFLLARTTPVTAEVDWWVPVVVTLGLATTVLGGIQAVRAVDLKALLAGSTVSQLGFICATLAIGTEVALVAGLLHTVAHAAFKASLFTITGVIDHETGTRDLRELGGLRRTMPISAGIATLAGLSMAGVPPFLGFVSKEEVLDAFLELSVLAMVAVAATAVLTVTYTLRFVVGAFGGDRPGIGHEAPRSFLFTPAVVAAISLLGGLLLAPFDRLVSAAADAAAGTSGTEAHLALWHGFTPPLFASAAVLLVGFLVWRALGRGTAEHAPGPLDGPTLFDRLNTRVITLGGRTARVVLSAGARAQAGWVLGTLATVGVGVAFAVGEVTAPVEAGSTAEWVLVATVAITLLLLSRVHSRLGAAALIGSIGFLITGFFVLRRAPDLALTQILVEAVTVVLIVLVFRRLPDAFAPWPGRARIRLAAIAIGAGVGVATIAATMLGPRPASDLSLEFLATAEAETGGTNVVNTILVDFRALDTLGEITVLLVAAVGVYVVTRARRGETDVDVSDQPPTDEVRAVAATTEEGDR